MSKHPLSIIFTVSVALLFLLAACSQSATGSATEVAPAETETTPAVAETPAAEETAAGAEAPTDESSAAETSVSISPSGAYPADVQTGIIDVDAVIAAALSGDPGQLRPLLGLLTTPCTNAEGLGGPPKCADDQAEGTEVTVFPVLGAEGGFLREDELDGMLETLDISGLYGVYIVPRDREDEPYWPRGDYGLVFTGNSDYPATTLLMEEGRIVRIVYHLGVSAAEAFDNGRGEIILAPLE